MKLIVFLAIAGISSAANLDNTYLPPSHAPSSGGNHDFLQTPALSSSSNYQRNAANQGLGQDNHGNYAQSYTNGNQNGFAVNNFEGNNQGFQERAQAAFERNAAILRLDNENDGNTFAYAYETENGISADEHGVATNGVEAEGGYSYTGDDGQVYSIRYTADQNGFVPQGDHLPTPPPIPQEILEALEKNAQDEAAGIFDDGTYNAAKYNNGEDNGNNNDNKINYNQEYIGNDDDSVVTNNAFTRNGDKGFRNQGFGNHGSQGDFYQGSQRNSNQGTNAVTQAYLPPVARQNNQVFGHRQLSGNQQPQRLNNFAKQTPTFNNQQGSQYRKQGPNTQTGANSQAYLPPFESQRSSKNNFRNQGSRNQGANRAYLPPL